MSTYVTEKFIWGRVLDADGEPDVGKTVSAVLSDAIMRVGDGLIIETDEAVTATTDSTGKFLLELHPNNQPGDQPLNTHWTLTLPNSGPFELVIPYDAVGGDTAETAIKWTTLVTPPDDLDPPENVSALDDRVTYLESSIDALFDLDADALEALSPARPTTLIEYVMAASAVATSSTDGLMSSTDKTKLDDIGAAALVAKYDATGALIIKPAAGPTTVANGEGRMWVGLLDGYLKAQVGSSTGGRTTLAPALDTPVWQASSDVNVTVTNPTNLTLATLAVEANSLYRLDGVVGYRFESGVDLMLGFGGIPSGATLIWGYLGPESGRAASTSIGSVNNTRRTGTATLTLGGVGSGTDDDVIAQVMGVLRVGATAGTITVLVNKANAGANGVIRGGTMFTLSRLL